MSYETPEARRVDHYVQAQFARKERLVSRYGDEPNEWFAEAYAAWSHSPATRSWLKDYSPVAYETVKQVRRMRGMQ